ncbi:uncharacterized protein LOC126746208 [Anthonomus grandis grandis]|uniref:uncharacterized protein LOC126746208 n=1 Tax=Anthonomus grandis grandis TaxID=2921223 RepID=UPI002165C3F6|nr:uncharacterized protein LOC126746208 [Anthonomus grandis grandis]
MCALACLIPGDSVHLRWVHLSSRPFIDATATHLAIPTIGSGPIGTFADPSLARESACSLPAWPAWPGIQTSWTLHPTCTSFFRKFQFFNNACNTFIRTNPTRKIDRLQFGQLLSKAWSKAAKVEHAVSAFRSTGVCPFNPSAIPDYAYLGSEEEMINLDNTATVNNDANRVNNDENQMPKQEQAIPSTSTSGLNNIPSERDEDQNQDAPGTLLNKFSPVPSTSANIENARKRAKQVACVLTSPEIIQKQRL